MVTGSDVLVAASASPKSDQLPGMKVRMTSPVPKPLAEKSKVLVEPCCTGSLRMPAPRPGPPRMNSGASSVTEPGSTLRPLPAKVTATVPPLVTAPRLTSKPPSVASATIGSVSSAMTNSLPGSTIESRSSSKPVGGASKVTLMKAESESTRARSVNPRLPGSAVKAQLPGRNVTLISPVAKVPLTQ